MMINFLKNIVFAAAKVKNEQEFAEQHLRYQRNYFVLKKRPNLFHEWEVWCPFGIIGSSLCELKRSSVYNGFSISRVSSHFTSNNVIEIQICVFQSLGRCQKIWNSRSHRKFTLPNPIQNHENCANLVLFN